MWAGEEDIVLHGDSVSKRRWRSAKFVAWVGAVRAAKPEPSRKLSNVRVSAP